MTKEYLWNAYLSITDFFPRKPFDDDVLPKRFERVPKHFYNIHLIRSISFFFYDNGRGGLPALDNVHLRHVGHVLYLAKVVPGTILQSIVLFRAIKI